MKPSLSEYLFYCLLPHVHVQMKTWFSLPELERGFSTSLFQLREDIAVRWVLYSMNFSLVSDLNF